MFGVADQLLYNWCLFEHLCYSALLNCIGISKTGYVSTYHVTENAFAGLQPLRHEFDYHADTCSCTVLLC